MYFCTVLKAKQPKARHSLSRKAFFMCSYMVESRRKRGGTSSGVLVGEVSNPATKLTSRPKNPPLITITSAVKF